jgi:hypothetical protein
MLRSGLVRLKFVFELPSVAGTIGKRVVAMDEHHHRATGPGRSQIALVDGATTELPEAYRRACRLAADGRNHDARRFYAGLN